MPDAAAKARRVLVAGGEGQIGRALVASAPSGVAVLGLSRAALDIGDAAAVARAVAQHRPDVIVNAAAYTAVDRAEAEPERAFAINADAPATLARIARDAGVRLVHLSSDFVFDGRACEPYREEHAVAPLSVYGASKAAGEAAVRGVLPEALIVRTSWVYAARGGNFVRTMLRLMRESGTVRVVADQVGTPTHAASFARSLWSLVDRNVRGTCHLSDGGAASWCDFAQAIGEEATAIGLLPRAPTVVPIRTADYPTPARRPAFSVLDSARTWARLGRASSPWRSELREMLGELRELRA